MALAFQGFRPVKGLFSSFAEDLIPEDFVQQSDNFIFLKGEARVRPKLVAASYAAIAEQIVFGYCSPGLAKLLIGASGKIYKDVAGVATEITAATTAYTISDTFRACNIAPWGASRLLIGNSTNGLKVWNTADATYSSVDAATYRFFIGHNARVVGAGGLGALNSMAIGWSKIGDHTDWSSPYGGTSILSDATSIFTGFGMINKVLVIVRQDGFHLGFPTGSTPPYRLECWSKEAAGAPTWGKATFDRDICYFIGSDNVYSFDLTQVKPLGDAIRNDLIAALALTANYGIRCTHGLSSGTINAGAKQSEAANLLHVFPQDLGAYPHFVYDIDSQAWAKLSYTVTLRGCMEMQSAEGFRGPVWFSNANGSYYYWDTAQGCERASSLKTKTAVLGGEEYNARVQQVLLKHRAIQAAAVTVTLAGELEGTAVNTNQTQTLGAAADSKLTKKWFNVPLTAQNFDITVSVVADKRFRLSLLGFRYDSAGVVNA